MLPPLDEDGTLPPGIHKATWNELVEQVGTTPHRLWLLEGLREALQELRSAGCRVAFVDGSFVTAKENPGDYDACWDLRGVDLDRISPILLRLAGRRAQKAKYRGDLFPAQFGEARSGMTFLEFFQVDKETGGRKGIIEINLETLND